MRDGRHARCGRTGLSWDLGESLRGLRCNFGGSAASPPESASATAADVGGFVDAWCVPRPSRAMDVT